MQKTHPYKTFNNYLLEKFGTRVYRVPVDAGFTCPNRDGVRAIGGCTFCDERGSGAPTIKSSLSIQHQLDEGVDRIRYRFKAKKFLAYFQAFTNTYAPEATLKSIYDIAVNHPDISGLVIGTRPDCIPDNILDLLAEYQKKTFVFLELGLQTAHNRTLNLLNRGHSAEEFFDALKRTQERKIPVATHLIFGLPGETREDMLHSVRLVANSGVDAIKIHQLVVYKDAPMAKDYLDGQISLIEENDYVQLVADALEMLPEDMTVMRLVAEGTKEEVLAPKWCLNKFATMDLINQEMSRRNSRQGAKYVKENLDELLEQSGYNLAQFLPLTTIVAAPITPA